MAGDLDFYLQALKQNGLSEDNRHIIETKIAIYSFIVTQQAIARLTPSPVITPYATPAPLQEVPLPTGLWEGSTSDFHADEASIQNIWRQYVANGEWIAVYAGELGSGTPYPGRGVVYVLRLNAVSGKGNREEFVMPEGTGWVRISEVKGDYIILTSEEGNTFYFYIPGQQFVDSLDEVTITVTPMPTPTQRTNTLGPPPSPPPLPTPDPSQPYP